MAEPEPRAHDARTSRTSSRDAARGATESPAEDRVFDKGSEAARRATEAGIDASRDLSRASAETGRRLGETGARAFDRGADLWRQSIFPLTAFSFEMNRLFDEFWRSAVPNVAAQSLSPLSGPGAGLMQGLMGVPCADVHETPDGYHIVVELAGMRPQDVEVVQDGDSIVVRGEKRDDHVDDQGGFRVNERRFGRFERRFHLPRDVDREGVEAEFRNGLLEIRAVRRRGHEHGRRMIEVKHDGRSVESVKGRPPQARA
jgi:HSP20 family protein